jgi:hypothetical protein
MRMAQPAEQGVAGRHLGQPTLAGIASFQMFTRRFRRGQVERAEVVRPQGFVGRVDGGGGAHNAISCSGSSVTI